jgi:uncharacterized protein YjdB
MGLPIDKIRATSLEINKSQTILAVGETEVLSVTASPKNTSTLTFPWFSDNPAVVEVTNGSHYMDNRITAISPGTATITVKDMGEGGIAAASCIVTVGIPVTEITVNNAPSELTIGGKATLSATISPSNATIKDVTWTTSDAAVATVSTSGQVTAIAPGTATITVAAADGSGTKWSWDIKIPIAGV